MVARERSPMNGHRYRGEVGVSIAVVGPGAIGSTVAACLHQAGHTPLLCGRTARDHLDVRPDSTVLGGEPIRVPIRVRTDPGEVTKPVELVLFAVKATQIGRGKRVAGSVMRPQHHCVRPAERR